tara:strand:+ start:725 stop:952 length:228 start_codon:yes stop_codon:yes gene_type:complete
MITIHTYKLQGNGSDSWHVDVHDCETEAQATRENRISREIVFNDPTKQNAVSMDNFDLNTMTSEQLTQLKNLLGL